MDHTDRDNSLVTNTLVARRRRARSALPTLGSRIFFATVFLTLAALATAWYGIDTGLDGFAMRSNETRLQDARRSLDTALDMQARVQLGHALAIASRREIHEVLALPREARTKPAVTLTMQALNAATGQDLLVLFDEGGTFVAASSHIAPRDATLSGTTIANPRQNASEVARVAGHLALATRRTIEQDGSYRGSLVCVDFIDRDFIGELAAAVGTDITIVSDGKITWRAGSIAGVQLSPNDVATLVSICDQDCTHRVRIDDIESFAIAKEVSADSRFVLSQSTGALIELYANLKGWLLPAVIVIVIATLVTSRFVSRRLSAPISALSHAADEVASGRLDAVVPTDANTAEIARLQDAFGEMTTRLRTLLEDVQNKNAALASQRDELARANRAKSNFLATASHELRTPISSIKSFSEILLGGGADDEPEETKNEFLGIIRGESERLARLVEQLLDLATIESGVASWHNEDVDLGSIASKTLRALAGFAGAQHVRLKLDIDEDSLPYRGDPDRLQQTFTNLVGNAIKFSPKQGSVTLGIRRDTFGFQIRIDDEGPGVPEAERGRIFEKFVQSEDILTDKPQGSGLGLAIVREIVLVHGGRVRCEAAPSGGARFVVRLPEPHALRPLDRYVAEAKDAREREAADETTLIEEPATA
ncbi:MAG: HAMP domain-containing protein [Planctomycetes bacterium]|nr:HAMP domain-containing protein [Planctomycetota bacterium]